MMISNITQSQKRFPYTESFLPKRTSNSNPWQNSWYFGLLSNKWIIPWKGLFINYCDTPLELKTLIQLSQGFQKGKIQGLNVE